MSVHALRELERTEHRVLGGIEVTDGTSGARIYEPLQITAPGARIVRNSSALYVVWEWDQLPEHAAAFLQPPPLPGVGSLGLVLTLNDQSGTYMPRTATVALPRNAAPDPASRALAGSLFQPMQLSMLRAGSAPMVGNWSRLDVRVVAAGGSGDLLGAALVIVRDGAGTVLARGLTDWRGEAVVPVAAVPITTFSSDTNAVVVSEIAATVQALFVPAWGSRVPRDQVDAGQPPAGLTPVDPDRIPAQPQVIAAAPVAIQLAARRSRSVQLQVAVP